MKAMEEFKSQYLEYSSVTKAQYFSAICLVLINYSNYLKFVELIVVAALVLVFAIYLFRTKIAFTVKHRWSEMLFYFGDQFGSVLSILAFLPFFDRFVKWVSVYFTAL
jgi:hypothetical protein